MDETTHEEKLREFYFGSKNEKGQRNDAMGYSEIHRLIYKANHFPDISQAERNEFLSQADGIIKLIENDHVRKTYQEKVSMARREIVPDNPNF